MLNVRFRARGRTTFQLNLPLEATMSQVRWIVLDSRHDVAPDVKFIFNGQLLHDSRLLCRLNLSPSDSIVLHSPPAAFPNAPDPVRVLLDLGFPRDRCVAALRAAGGDANRAATCLLAGDIPAPPSSALDDLRKLLSERPGALENVVRSFEIAAPKDDGPWFRQHPEELIAMVKLDSAQFDIEAVRNRTARPLILGEKVELSEGDRAAVQRLQEITRFPPETVVQAYLACDRSEQDAATLLAAMAD
jgi:hypothetical protein